MSGFHEVIVAGLGAMGSCALHHLARRGHRVMGVDRFAPPHAMGSSHGKSRIIREAYFEDPRYVPLVQRAYECWAALEAESGVRLFRQTGGLMLGPPDGTLVRGARLSADLHGLPHELLDAREVARRFPAFRPEADWVGVWEPRAGMLHPERAIESALTMARAHGAEVRTHETVLGWDAIPGGVEVTTTSGRHRAAALIVSVGAWTAPLLADLALPLVVQRNVLHWFAPAAHAEHFTPEALPIFINEIEPGHSWYGFPDTGDGVKLARHHYGAATTADLAERTVAPNEVAEMRTVVARYMPDANGTHRESAACLYTNAPDEHFLIGRHPRQANVIVASPCSGHGFKFASAIGEILGDLATERTPTFDMSLFAIDRFAAA
ncbi:MAG: N-methyl-L-tryptophan oxidase [Gemmatimonadaceae bacterium]|jgi:sarcosine oxidase|nr:N-methyl-L-tryptophan oxidase [Gemmatimonadaceae bacterium]